MYRRKQRRASAIAYNRRPVTPVSTIHYADAGLTFATCANVALCVLRSPLTLERLRHLRRETESHKQRFGDNRVVFNIIEPAAIVSPDAQVRAECVALARDFPATFEVTVLERGGFRSAAARAILNSFALLSGNRSGRRTFDCVEPAVDAIVEHRGAPSLGRDELLAFVAKARAPK